MDFDAIIMSSDEDLKELGLANKGDILSVKNVLLSKAYVI